MFCFLQVFQYSSNEIMSLVAYENSDSSDYEDDCNDTSAPNSAQKSDQHAPTQTMVTGESDNKPNEIHIFNLLPKPIIKKIVVTEEDDEFLHKKEDPTDAPKPKARIMIPSLSDFKDVNDTVKVNKPRISNGKKSGLLGILPQPKNSYTTSLKSLIPQILTTKKTESLKKALPVPTSSKTNKAKLKTPVPDSDDSDDDVQTDFFAMNKPVEIPIIDLPLDKESNVTATSSIHDNAKEILPQRSIASYFKEIDEEPATTNDMSPIHFNSHKDNNQQEQHASSSNGDVELDEEAIMKLCGTRGKRKREDIQIVDINQQAVLDDAKQWLLKGLMDDTSKRTSSSKRKGNEPTNQQKRKHQITYLAHQAKANEAELQNQWANNRMSKRQTQSKYGF